MLGRPSRISPTRRPACSASAGSPRPWLAEPGAEVISMHYIRRWWHAALRALRLEKRPRRRLENQPKFWPPCDAVSRDPQVAEYFPEVNS